MHHSPMILLVAAGKDLPGVKSWNEIVQGELKYRPNEVSPSTLWAFWRMEDERLGQKPKSSLTSVSICLSNRASWFWRRPSSCLICLSCQWFYLFICGGRSAASQGCSSTSFVFCGSPSGGDACLVKIPLFLAFLVALPEHLAHAALPSPTSAVRVRRCLLPHCSRYFLVRLAPQATVRPQVRLAP